MDIIWRYFKVQLPGYLRTLPLPKSFAEVSELTRDDWLTLVPFLLFLLILFYLALSPILNLCQGSKQPRPKINRKVKPKEGQDIIKEILDIEDVGKKVDDSNLKCVSYCRCWKSSEFPLCDGSHKKHNKATNDNVGPLVIKKLKGTS